MKYLLDHIKRLFKISLHLGQIIVASPSKVIIFIYWPFWFWMSPVDSHHNTILAKSKTMDYIKVNSKWHTISSNITFPIHFRWKSVNPKQNKFAIQILFARDYWLDNMHGTHQKVCTFCESCGTMKFGHFAQKFDKSSNVICCITWTLECSLHQFEKKIVSLA